MRFPVTLRPWCRILVFCLLAGVTSLWAAENRDVRTGSPSEWVEALSLPAPAASPETSIGWHYLLVESQTHAEQKISFNRNAYRIISDLGLRYGSQINISFDPAYETLTLHHIRLIRNGQVIDKLDPRRIQVIQQEEDLQRLLYNGELTALLILEDVRVGDTVDYAYSKQGRNPVFGDHYLDYFPLGWGVPVEHLRHRLIHALARPVADRVAGQADHTRTERDTRWGHERLWEARHLPAVVYDDNVPGWYESYAYVQLTDFPSWRAVIDWALPLYGTEPDAGPELAQKAAELAASAATDEERVTAALKFVQEEVRYLGIALGAGSHRPAPPRDVLARRFGDCKDQSLLLCQLLRLMGIKAAPMLVHSSRRHTLGNWLPSPYAFDHAIVMAWVGKFNYQLDPTLSYQRGPLPYRHITRYGPGLVLEPGFQDLLTMKPGNNDIADTRVEEVFTVKGLHEPADLMVRTTYSGRAASSMRSQLTGSTREELTRQYLDFYARYYPEISSSRPLVWSDNEPINTVTVEEHYRINNLFAPAEEDDDKLLIAEFHPSTLNGYTDPVGAPGRTAPLHLSHPVTIRHHTLVNLYEDWNFDASTHEVTDAGFRFKREIGGSASRLEFTYQWDSVDDHIRSAGFADHVKNLKRVNDLLGYQLSYNQAVGGAARFDLHWLMIALHALVVLAAVAGSIYLVRLRPSEPPLLPATGTHDARLTGIGGWLQLVGFGIIIRPFYLLYSISTSLPTYYNLDTWRAATNPDLSTYLPSFAVIAPVEMTFNTLLCALSLLLVPLFFGRNRHFPAAMVFLLVLACVAAAFNAWAQPGLKATATEQTAAYTDVGRALLVALIWIPYFRISRRVKLTFTR